jgi:hypothetical protein
MTVLAQVCPRAPIAKDKFQQNLAAAWGRIWPKVGKGMMADRMGLADTKTIDRAVTASNLPEAHTIFNSLCADPTALDEVLALYGYRLCPNTADAANDMQTLSGLCEAAGEMADALKDGVRVHQETLRIAEKLRPHMPSLTAIMSEADSLRGAA